MTTKRVTLFSDRATRRRLLLVVGAVIVLMVLIGFLTFLPAGTITTAAQNQSAEAQRLLAASYARQIESFFNNLSNVLFSLASRPAIQSATGLRDTALRLLAEAAAANPGQIKAIVRLSQSGVPRYAYPAELNDRIEAGQPLDWQVDAEWISEVARVGGIQFTRRSSGSGVTYLLVTPVNTGVTVEAIAIEVDIEKYLDETFRNANIGQEGQIWVLTTSGNELYSARPQPAFRSGTAQLVGLTESTTFPAYPTEDRESVAVPVYTSFTQSRDSAGSLVLILSRTLAEANLVVQNTLQSLGLFSIGVIAFVVLFGVLVGLFLLRESARLRREQSRRQTANTLLDVSRALNSSLDLNVVLQRILDNLGSVIPHDSAALFLLNEDKTKFRSVAELGDYNANTLQREFALNEIKGAFEVYTSQQPVVIPDTRNDPRWDARGSRTQSWLGVPLRVRDEVVGVLNIDSFQPNNYTEDDVSVALALADQAGVAVQNARNHEMQIRAYEQELETARAIQTSLLPQEPPPLPEVEVAARSIPAKQVSGDYYQYYALPNGKLGIAVGDVSGKGIPAALLMAVITTTLRDEILRESEPATLLHDLNVRLLPRMQQNRMNSGLTLAVFDPVKRTIELSAGGMNSPYLKTAQGWQEIEIGGYPLGAAERASYQTERLDVPPQSFMIFVTDGVTEAQNRQGELFGFDRLEAVLALQRPEFSAEHVATAILNAVREHLDGQDPQDDITIVVMKTLSPAAAQ
ncbi:MAG: hypothetical protein OHK0023_06140 [Anaerolineae bacterium]